MWRIKRRLLMVAVAGATACSLGAFAGVASAQSLDRTNPMTTGCSNGAYTLHSTPVTDPLGAVIGQVELRYSPTCHTKWARIDTSSSYGGGAWMEAYAVRGNPPANTVGADGDVTRDFYGTQVYSDQLYGYGERVCGYGTMFGYWGQWTDWVSACA